MLRKMNYKFLVGLPLLLLSVFHVFGQVTTATLSGIVKDPKGQPLAAATVSVEYANAGIKQGRLRRADGRFTVPNLRVGGPYKVTVSFLGYQENVTDNIFLELGLNNALEIQMQERAVELKNVTVTGRSVIFDNKKTSPSTNITTRTIRALPTISRSADDYLRL